MTSKHIMDVVAVLMVLTAVSLMVGSVFVSIR